jgi:hypothetical protein
MKTATLLALLMLTFHSGFAQSDKASREWVKALQVKVDSLQTSVDKLGDVDKLREDIENRATATALANVRRESNQTAEDMHFIILLASVATFLISVFGTRILDRISPRQQDRQQSRAALN